MILEEYSVFSRNENTRLSVSANGRLNNAERIPPIENN